MPTKGQITTNPANGNIYEFVETAKDTNGERVTLKATIKSQGQLVLNHFHAHQDETFEVISGQLTILLNGETMILSAGEKITLPKNIPHNHYNNEDATVTYIHSVTPALDFDYLIETLAGLASDVNVKKRKYRLIQDLVTLKYFDSKSYVADVPVGIQKMLANTVAPIARLFGYRAIYEKYSGIEK